MCDGYQDCDRGKDEANCGTQGTCKYNSLKGSFWLFWGEGGYRPICDTGAACQHLGSVTVTHTVMVVRMRPTVVYGSCKFGNNLPERSACIFLFFICFVLFFTFSWGHGEF